MQETVCTFKHLNISEKSFHALIVILHYIASTNSSQNLLLPQKKKKKKKKKKKIGAILIKPPLIQVPSKSHALDTPSSSRASSAPPRLRKKEREREREREREKESIDPTLDPIGRGSRREDFHWTASVDRARRTSGRSGRQERRGARWNSVPLRLWPRVDWPRLRRKGGGGDPREAKKERVNGGDGWHGDDGRDNDVRDEEWPRRRRANWCSR